MTHTGTVQKGGGYGRMLGFPTANISCDDTSLSGIYAATVRCEGEEYSAAVYADTKRQLLEAHLLSFSGDLYGKEIEIELLKKIRDDKEFADDTEAKRAIAADVEAVEAYFRTL